MTYDELLTEENEIISEALLEEMKRRREAGQGADPYSILASVCLTWSIMCPHGSWNGPECQYCGTIVLSRWSREKQGTRGERKHVGNG